MHTSVNELRTARNALIPSDIYTPFSGERAIGLSISSNLTARISVKTLQNGEGKIVISKIIKSKSASKGKPKGRKKGQVVQQGLTVKGKRTIRVISGCYNLMILDDETDTYDKFCRFITLSFRNIIPSDSEAKKLLDSFLKRFRRQFGDNIHYVWVAERQKRGVIHFHLLTPEKIVKDKTGAAQAVAENIWINRAWNEVVCNWAEKVGHVTSQQANDWRNEYALSEKYYKALVRFKAGQRTTQPRKPKRSKYLLLPNCIHVQNAGNYMSKYMSKEGQKIVGNMYNASSKSREFLIEDVKQIPVLNTDIAEKVLELVREKIAVSKAFSTDFQKPEISMYGTWMQDASKLETYLVDSVKELATNLKTLNELSIERELLQRKRFNNHLERLKMPIYPSSDVDLVSNSFD